MRALLDDLLAQERRVWEALVAGDAAADLAALAPDFLGVYPDGFSGCEAHAAQLAAGPSVQRYDLTQARVVPAGPDHALLVYRAQYLRTGSARSEAMYVSSLWQRAGEGWINLFSQDTPETGESVP